MKKRKDQTNGDTGFNIENLSNNGEEKITGARQQYLIIPGESTNTEDLQRTTYPKSAAYKMYIWW